MPLEHDDRCNRQDTDIMQLKTELGPMHRDMDAIIQRVQLLVDQYHTQNVAMAKLQGDVSVLCQRVPNDLPDQLATMREQMKNMRDDLGTLRIQWYSIVGTILTALIVAAVTFIVRGGLAP